MNQRGIDQQLVELVNQYGKLSYRGDVQKFTLSRKGVDATVRELDVIRSRLLKARDKGGVVVVESDEGVQITTYRAESRH